MSDPSSRTNAAPRVLIAHRYFWPADLSQFPEMLKDLAEWHVARGHKVTVATATATKAEYQSRRTDWAREQGVHLMEIDLPVDRGRSLFRRLGSMFAYKRFLDRTLSEQRPDLLICTSCPSLIAGWSARRARKKQGVRYAYYIQDILPEMLSANSIWTRPLGGLLVGVDRRIVAEADATITISEEMRDTLLSRPGATGRVHVVPNYALRAGEKRKPKPKNDVPTLVFAGNFGKLQAIDHFLRAAHLATPYCDFRVKMVGGGSELEKLTRLSKDLGMRNIEFTGVLSREDAQEMIEQADVGVVSAREGLYKIAFPSKIYSYLLSGVPPLVFTDESSPVADWLQQNHLGCVASPSKVEQAADALVRCVRSVSQGDFDGEHIARFTADQLSRERYLESYAQIMDGLIDAGSSRLARAA